MALYHGFVALFPTEQTNYIRLCYRPQTGYQFKIK